MDAGYLSSFVRREDLLQALRSLTNRTDIKLLDGAEIKRATAGIEGFLSLVLRVRVPFCYLDDNRRRTEVFVLKCMPKQGMQSEVVKEMEVFSREGLYFDKIAPLLRRVSAGKVVVPLPMCYHSVYGGDNDVLYMEDLAASGHSTPDIKFRGEGLDFEHCSIAMKAYGRLHALSVAAEKCLPEGKNTWIEAFPELKKDSVLPENPGGGLMPFRSFVEECGKTLLVIAKQLDGLPKEAEASGRLSIVVQKTLDVMYKLVQPNSKGYNVLCHGDCWMNNLMFQYDIASDGTKKPVGVKFVDHQISRYCHPCIDILYFIYIDTRKSFREKHTDELISIYYNSFVENLKILNHPPLLTLEEFRSDYFGVYRAQGHYCESLFSPMMIMGEEFTPSNAEDLTPERYDELVSTGNSNTILDHFATKPQYRAIVSQFVRDFVDAAFPNGLEAPESPLFSI